MKRIVLATIFLLALGLSAFGLIQVTAGGQPADDGICPDFTGDKKVLVGDILYVVGKYSTADQDADLNSNGIVLVDDILRVIKNYSETCTFPTPAATPYDYTSAGGQIPPGYSSKEEFVNDWLDDHLLNHSNGGGAGTAGQTMNWINAGCAVSSAPDCVIPDNSQIIIHPDGSFTLNVPTPEPNQGLGYYMGMTCVEAGVCR